MLQSSPTGSALPAAAAPYFHPLREVAVQTLLNLIRQGFSFALSFSAGKDSTVCAVLLIEAVRRAVAEGTTTTHFINSANTGVENPMMEYHLVTVQDEMTKHFAQHGLPITVNTVYPSIASSFVVSTIGRGTLPRFPENGKARSCSVDWKVLPGQRLAKQLEADVMARTGRELITIIGTRFSESTGRDARMTARGESSTEPVRDSAGRLVLSLIAAWDLDDVWDTLETLLDPDDDNGTRALSQESVHRLFELYRDANEGTCGISLGDQGNKAPCGPRFGCAVCTIAGAKDKSMESMLKLSKYEFMQPLNQFRNLLMATQHNLDLREMIGRKISPAGYIPIQPDVYSYAFRRTMLGYLLSIDADERDRAETVEAQIVTGQIPDTPTNRMLASPMFEMVSLSQLALIDFHWGMHAYASRAFPALALWYDINVLGRRYRVPDTLPATKLGIPTRRWFYVGKFDHAVPTDGLRDYESELWNRYRHPTRPFANREINGAKTVWFDEEDSMSVDAEKACEFITCTFPSMMIESADRSALESTRFWLNEEIIKLPAGHAARYQHMAKRGQYIANLAERLNLTPKEMDQYLAVNSITNAEHDRLNEAAASEERDEPQLDLFDLIAA